jgi:RNA polymerase sigma-70 factor (ECF subfamily)
VAIPPAMLASRSLNLRSWAEQLVHRFGPMVYRRARTILGDADEAKDVTQEVFITVLRLESAIHEEASSWLYRVTTNACLNRLRANRRYAAMRERSSEQAPGESSQTMDAQSVVRRLLAEGEPACTAAAVYVFVEGMSHEEAAEILGVSRRTVGNLLERFVSWAQSRLAELGDDSTTNSHTNGGRP